MFALLWLNPFPKNVLMSISVDVWFNDFTSHSNNFFVLYHVDGAALLVIYFCFYRVIVISIIHVCRLVPYKMHHSYLLYRIRSHASGIDRVTRPQSNLTFITKSTLPYVSIFHGVGRFIEDMRFGSPFCFEKNRLSNEYNQ